VLAARTLGVPLVQTYHTDLHAYADAYRVPHAALSAGVRLYAHRLGTPPAGAARAGPALGPPGGLAGPPAGRAGRRQHAGRRHHRLRLEHLPGGTRKLGLTLRTLVSTTFNGTSEERIMSTLSTLVITYGAAR